jgi:hypothetical protein
MARLFNALVLTGAAISASACAGKSTRSEGEEAGAGGSAGTTGGDSGSPSGGTATGGSQNTGGVPPTGGTTGGTIPTGGVSTGGSTTTGGTAGVAGLPEPGSRAQWNCEFLVPDRVCVDVLGTTATPIPDMCPVELDRPRSSADCAAGERFTCILAVTPSSELTLVNCRCEPGDYTCYGCTNLSQLHGEPAYCDGVRKVCACAYTGILL